MPLPVLSVAEMRSLEDATWATGKTPEQVISRVGELLAQCLRQLAAPGSTIILLAGKGHNGDDTRACLPHLDNHIVHLVECQEPEAGLADWLRIASKADLVVDGLFGIGLNRILDAAWLRLIEAVNRSTAPIIAVDVPSGLSAETGTPLGGAIRASLTLTLGAPKRGLLVAGAERFGGRLEVIRDIGLVEVPHNSEQQAELVWSSAEDYLNFPPRRLSASHKGTYGHVGIIAGSSGYHGAAGLAARGAQRAGAGLVTVLTPEESYLPIACQLQSAMVRPWRSAHDLPEGLSALVVGPGLASPSIPKDLMASLVELWRSAPLPVVADASALGVIGETRFPELRIITPHPGEAGRLLGLSPSEVQMDRVNALRRLSGHFGGCLVVLKGHLSLVGRDVGPITVNGSGNPGLAQGGSGDVLAGFLGGLVGQKHLQADLARAVAFGVWEHGAAADRLGLRRHRYSTEELATELGQWTGKTLPPVGPIC